MPNSLRHPQIQLLDTIAIKLLCLANPGKQIFPHDMERAREIVNDPNRVHPRGGGHR